MWSIFTTAAIFCAAASVVRGDDNHHNPNKEPPKLDKNVLAALRALGREHLRYPGSLPYPELPPGTDTMSEIEHIILLMMENHSYDNMFGMLGRGNGFTLDHDGKPTVTNPYSNGTIQHSFRMPTTCQLPSQPSQEWTASHVSINEGRMDGFVRAPITFNDSMTSGAVAMGYYTAEDLPTIYSLAKQFPIADYYFSSVAAQTFPNRQYLIAGTSMGITSDNMDLSELAPPMGTIFTLLDKYNITWRNYVAEFPGGASPELFPITDNLTEAVNHGLLPDFFTDAAKGTLPMFSFLEPNYTSTSQENPQNVVNGDAFISDVVHAIGHSSKWSKSLFILTYDEGGGYHDHVTPPVALPPDEIQPIVMPGELLYTGFAQYGMRVPTVVVSPYAKKDFVSHVLYDHTSILAMLEAKHNLPALTYRDANANNMHDFIDFDAMKRRKPNFPIMPRLAPPGNTTAALACSLTGPGVIPPPGTTSHPKDNGDHHDHNHK